MKSNNVIPLLLIFIVIWSRFAINEYENQEEEGTSLVTIYRPFKRFRSIGIRTDIRTHHFLHTKQGGPQAVVIEQ
jgi:hypothetical protein